MKIGLISDTHGFLDEKVFTYFKNVDEIWHAGDIGTIDVLQQLKNFKRTLAVYGNIDHNGIQEVIPEDLIFMREEVKVYMTHIGGKPPSYNPKVRPIIDQERPRLFICGHSHILKVMQDPKREGLIYINPGAAGKQGFHRMKTLIRFEINKDQIENMQVIELGLRAKA